MSVDISKTFWNSSVSRFRRSLNLQSSPHRHCACPGCDAHSGLQCGATGFAKHLFQDYCKSCSKSRTHTCACEYDCRHHSNCQICALPMETQQSQRARPDGTLLHMCSKCAARNCACLGCEHHSKHCVVQKVGDVEVR